MEKSNKKNNFLLCIEKNVAKFLFIIWRKNNIKKFVIQDFNFISNFVGKKMFYKNTRKKEEKWEQIIIQ